MEKDMFYFGTPNYNLDEFDEDQKTEIQMGIELGLDVSWYAKREFLAIQMRQIRLGLLKGLNVSAYASTEYDWFQMEEIRRGLKAGIGYKIYADPKVDYKCMRQIRLGLMDGIDLSAYIHYDAGILEELRKAIQSNVSIMKFIEEGYEVSQLTQIRYALEKGLDIKPYICTELVGSSIREIALGLEQDLPVEMYATLEYDWRQMREIRLGMEQRLDVERYRNSLFSWKQMREIRLGMEEGLDVDIYSKFMYSGPEMERIRERLLAEETKNLVSEEEVIADGEIVVFISQDEMEACIEVRYDNQAELTVKHIMNGLKRNGVLQGILKEEVERLVKEKRYRQTIVIAKGRPAKKGEDGYYEFFFNTNPDRTPKILPDGSADFRNIDIFEMVKEGDRIAYYHAAGFGAAGYTVRGNYIRPQKGHEQKTLAGRGFRLGEDGKTYYAAIDGKIDLIDGERIDISRACELEQVNLATGDVMFEGSVHVKGNVGSGVTIYASDALVVDGYVEAACIRCGGDVLLRRGVNGQGIIEAKGRVTGLFFEAAKVVAGGDISAQYFLNCDLYTEGSIFTYGQRGMLAGGVARAAKGVKAYTIGNRIGLRTILNVGVDANVLNNLRHIEAKIETVNKELRILHHSYEDFQKRYAPEVRNAMELYLKIENAIYTKELQLRELNEYKQNLAQQIKDMMGARVVVSDILHEGVMVTVDNVKWRAFMIKDVNIRCRNKKIVVEANQ